MKLSKNVPKCKPKRQISCDDDAEAKTSRANSKTSFGKVRNSSTTMTTKKLVIGVVSDMKRAPMAEQTYSSFVSGISDCSSCDQHRTEAVNFKSVEEDCEHILQQFTNTFAEIGRSLTNSDDVRQIAVQCLEYVNVVSFNIEKLERERSRAIDYQTELNNNRIKLQQDRIDLQREIESMQQINDFLKDESRRMVDELHAQKEELDSIQEENFSYRCAIENQKSTLEDELEKLAKNSVHVERAVVDKEVHWEDLNYHLQKRVATLQHDRDQLKVNYDLMCNALCVRNSGDVDNELMMDVGMLEAGHEAEMVMMKYVHESFISELNKSNCKLWNQKFFTRTRLEEEAKKSELYMSWSKALKLENIKYRDEITGLNSQIEQLLDDICTKLENVATETRVSCL